MIAKQLVLHVFPEQMFTLNISRNTHASTPTIVADHV